jgi:hypothetical protein
MKMLRRVVLPAELTTLVVLLGVMTTHTVVPLVGFAVYMIWSVVKVRIFWLAPVKLLLPDTDDGATILARRVLGPFYYGWMPLLLLTALVMKDRMYLVAVGLHLLLFGPMVMRLAVREMSLLVSLFTRRRRVPLAGAMRNS